MRRDPHLREQIRERIRERVSERLGATHMPSQEYKGASSIDRFFFSKGHKLIGYSGNAWMLAGTIISISQGGAALLFTILAASIRGFPIALPIIFGSLAAISVGLTFWQSRRMKKSIQPEVQITGSGRKMLYKIGSHIGWHDHDFQSRNTPPNSVISNFWRSLVGVKTASNVLNPKSAELLEAGCSHYNRIAGLLKLGKGITGRATSITPQIRAAADEAMISLVNHVGLLEENPESVNAIIVNSQTQIDKLGELADRYEEMLSGPITLEDRLSSTNVMDSVLDHLRMEAQAHEELRTLDKQDHI